MQFGRVYGFVTQRSAAEHCLTVVLDTGRDIRTVRDEPVSRDLDVAYPSWLADQLVQETIGVDLALEGWEVIGEDTPDPSHDEPGIGRSSIWIVRRT